MKIYNVSELNVEAREAILASFEYPVSVKGEITDYRASRGHQYFKLRDPSSGSTLVVFHGKVTLPHQKYQIILIWRLLLQLE